MNHIGTITDITRNFDYNFKLFNTVLVVVSPAVEIGFINFFSKHIMVPEINVTLQLI